MTGQDIEKLNLPDTPGVYRFLGENGRVLYIGKATSLKDRVRSYFVQDLLLTRGQLVADMLPFIEKIEVTPTTSVLEALILEAALIKQYLPHYNTAEKDDKSFMYVAVTDEDFPQVVTVRGKNIGKEVGYTAKYLFGPFPHGAQLREAMKIIRRIFPYRDEKCKPNQGRPCFNWHIGLCPGVCIGEISKADYAKRINHIRLFFEGKKQELTKSLEKTMREFASEQKFEQADQVKRSIFALDHIQDVALLVREKNRAPKISVDKTNSGGTEAGFRIEAYDVAHISGTAHVGVMTVVEDGELAKNQYRKFKIRTQRGANDIGALKEVLTRRFRHPEWPTPSLVAVDGGQAQLNAAREIVPQAIPVVSVVKDRSHKPKDVLGQLEPDHKPAILLANNEAHRFAIAYHRQMRGNLFRS